MESKAEKKEQDINRQKLTKKVAEMLRLVGSLNGIDDALYEIVNDKSMLNAVEQLASLATKNKDEKKKEKKVSGRSDFDRFYSDIKDSINDCKSNITNGFFPEIKVNQILNIIPMEIAESIRVFDSVLSENEILDEEEKFKKMNEYLVCAIFAYREADDIVIQAQRLVIWETIKKGAILCGLENALKLTNPDINNLEKVLKYLACVHKEENKKYIEIKEYDARLCMRLFKFAQKYPNVLYASVGIHQLYKFVAPLEAAIKEDKASSFWGADLDSKQIQANFRNHYKRRLDVIKSNKQNEPKKPRSDPFTDSLKSNHMNVETYPEKFIHPSSHIKPSTTQPDTTNIMPSSRILPLTTQTTSTDTTQRTSPDGSASFHGLPEKPVSNLPKSVQELDAWMKERQESEDLAREFNQMKMKNTEASDDDDINVED